MDSVNILIEGIDVDGLILPTEESEGPVRLYKVPIKLSKAPPLAWSKLFIAIWNEGWTTHHPPLTSIEGRRIVLESTTLEDIDHHHRERLLECVEKANGEYNDLQALKDKEQARNDGTRMDRQAEIRKKARAMNTKFWER